MRAVGSSVPGASRSRSSGATWTRWVETVRPESLTVAVHSQPSTPSPSQRTSVVIIRTSSAPGTLGTST